MAGSKPSTTPATPGPHTITISYTNGKIAVNPASITVDKRKKEHLQWVSDGDFEFYICFEDTPFNSYHYHRQNNASGEARDAASGKFKYSVEVDGKTLDPDVIVRP